MRINKELCHLDLSYDSSNALERNIDSGIVEKVIDQVNKQKQELLITMTMSETETFNVLTEEE